MATDSAATLVKLSDSGRTVADPAEDVRGRTVVDSAGEDIGTVEDLLVDDRDYKVRFLRVAHGGILGFGATPSYVPVDAIARITDDAVHLAEPRQRVSGAPRYDPETADEADYYESLYGYYGVPPFWGPGYVYPGYPFYR